VLFAFGVLPPQAARTRSAPRTIDRLTTQLLCAPTARREPGEAREARYVEIGPKYAGARVGCCTNERSMVTALAV
jgi:hypothetical protein